MLCPNTLEGAAEILDQKSVTRKVARDSKRTFHVVDGKARNETHACIPGFCTCKAYCNNVASKPDMLACKHELAVLLADALGLTLQHELDDAEWAVDFSRTMTLATMKYGTQDSR